MSYIQIVFFIKGSYIDPLGDLEGKVIATSVCNVRYVPFVASIAFFIPVSTPKINGFRNFPDSI